MAGLVGHALHTLPSGSGGGHIIFLFSVGAFLWFFVGNVHRGMFICAAARRAAPQNIWHTTCTAAYVIVSGFGVMDHQSVTLFAAELRLRGQSHLTICTVFLHILLLGHASYEVKIHLPLRSAQALDYIRGSFSTYLGDIVAGVRSVEVAMGQRRHLAGEVQPEEPSSKDDEAVGDSRDMGAPVDHTLDADVELWNRISFLTGTHISERTFQRVRSSMRHLLGVARAGAQAVGEAALILGVLWVGGIDWGSGGRKRTP